MKFKPKDNNATLVSIASQQPTIWALRRNVNDAGQNNEADATGSSIEGSLYEHLFGYDPIRIAGKSLTAQKTEAPAISAENPNLNIINSQTNFLVMEIASDNISVK